MNVWIKYLVSQSVAQVQPVVLHAPLGGLLHYPEMYESAIIVSVYSQIKMDFSKMYDSLSIDFFLTILFTLRTSNPHPNQDC